MRKTEKPKIEAVGGPMEGERITHPAFSQISASRISGSAALYDSEFTHQNFIRVSIKRSELRRSLSNNWHFDKEGLIEIDMSEAQWATFVSSLNTGGGVPCTLTRFNGEAIPQLEEPLNSVEKFAVERDEKMLHAMQVLKEMAAKVQDSKLTKKEKEELLWNIEQVNRGFGSSIDFIAAQFGEHMEKTKEKAKVEINAYATATLHKMGLEYASQFTPLGMDKSQGSDPRVIESSENTQGPDDTKPQ